MKRYLGVLLSFVLAVGLFSPKASASPAGSWKVLYKDYLIQALTNKSNLSFGQDWEAVLIDLDLDGVPELVAGEAYRDVIPVDFIKTVRNGQLVDIRQEIAGSSSVNWGKVRIGMNAFSVNKASIKLFIDNTTGAYKYIGQDGFSGVDDFGIWEYELCLSGTTLRADQIVRSVEPNPWRVDDGSAGMAEYYNSNNIKVSKADYDLLRRNYYANLTVVTHGAAFSTGARLYDYTNSRVNSAEIDTFLSSYIASDAINQNQIPSDWAEAEIDQALRLNLVPEELQGGYGNKITRLDFCRLVVHMLSVKSETSASTLLSDYGKKTASAVFHDTTEQSVLIANALGIVEGKEIGRFDPDGSITRQEAAVMLARTASVMGIDVSSRTGVSFMDSDQVAEWAKASVEIVSALEDNHNHFAVMNGTGAGLFSPEGNYSRQQAIVTIKRLYFAE